MDIEHENCTKSDFRGAAFQISLPSTVLIELCRKLVRSLHQMVWEVHERMPETEEIVLASIRRAPSASTQATAVDFGVCHNTVRHISRKEGLHPLNVIGVKLKHRRYTRRLDFVRWMLEMKKINPIFTVLVLPWSVTTWMPHGGLNVAGLWLILHEHQI